MAPARTWFSVAFLSSTGQSLGESGCCCWHCISSCMWELHGHVGSTDPCLSCCCWSPAPAVGGCWSLLCSSQSSSCPLPKEPAGLWWSRPSPAGERPGTHKGWRAAACIEQGEPGAGCSPSALQALGQVLWPAQSPQPCLGSRLPLVAVSRSHPRVVTRAGAAGEDGSAPSGSQWVTFAVSHPSAR